MSREGSPIILSDSVPRLIPHGLIDIMDIVWKYHAIEKAGVKIPEDFFTPGEMVKYTSCGIIESLKGGLIAFFFTPLAFGVIEKIVPVFGEYNPSIFDKFFSLALALSFTIMYGYVLTNITARYIFPFTKKIIKNFLAGAITGKLTITFAAFFLYHYLYVSVLNEDRVASFLVSLKWAVKIETLEVIYRWILEFKPVLLTSAWFIVLSTLILIGMTTGGILITKYKNREEEDF